MQIEVKGLYYSVAHYIVGHPKCGRLHGHTYKVTLTIKGDQQEPFRFVGGLDFSDLKRVLKEIIDHLDHRVLIPEGDPRVLVTNDVEGNVKVTIEGKPDYHFPQEDCALIDTPSSTAEDMANYILQLLIQRLDCRGCQSISLRLDEGPNQSATAVHTI